MFDTGTFLSVSPTSRMSQKAIRPANRHMLTTWVVSRVGYAFSDSRSATLLGSASTHSKALRI